MRRSLTFRIAVAAVTLLGCSDASVNSPADDSTFAQLQARVFTPLCVDCHKPGTDDARQSGLILTPGRAYESLVNAAAANANARADGLVRVKPFDPEKSLLYHKLHFADAHHARDYGNPMPLDKSLSVGQIEFVRKWIAEGAPASGSVADTALLSDRTPPPLTTFEPLARPARGYQLRIEPFTVQPNFERELFVYKAVGNTRAEYVTRIETSMRPGSHHLLVYTFRDNIPVIFTPQLNEVRDIRMPNGQLNLLAMAPMAFHVFFAGSMTQRSDYSFPAGVGLRIPANARVDLNSHYANRSSSSVTGEAYVNLHTADSSSIRFVASTLDMSNTDLRLPPRTRTTVTKTFTVQQTTRIFTLTSHMHEHGEKFEIRIAGGSRNGELVYTSADWEHPPIINFATPIVLQAGEGLTSTVTYNNTTDRTITFGLTSQDEMNIIFGYWY